jgi:hypothetical protein
LGYGRHDADNHHSLAEPSGFAKYLHGFSNEVARQVMRHNLRSLLAATS